MRNNFGNDDEPAADAGGAGVASPGAEGDVVVSREAGGEEAEQVEGRGGAGRFRWVARVASRVSKVGKRARGRVSRIVRKEQPAEEQQLEDS